MKKSVKIIIDTQGKIQHEYVSLGITKNPHLGAIFAELVQSRIITIDSSLSSAEKRELRIKGMYDSRDQVYVGVAKNIVNKRIIVTRNCHFYNPRNTSSVGIPNTIIAKHLKNKFEIYAKTADQILSEELVCNLS